MKIYYLLVKNLKEISRDKTNLFLILIFPALIMMLYGLMFNGGIIDVTTVNVGVLDLDKSSDSLEFIEMLENLSVDNSTKLFNVIALESETDGSEKIKNEYISSMIIIPENYSSYIRDIDSNSTIIIEGNPTSSDYIITQATLNILLIDYSNQLQNEVTGQNIKKINLISNNVNGTDDFNTFDFLAPGLIVFGIITTISTVATNVAKETENGMLRRLKLSKMKSRDFVASTLLSWSFIVIIQVLIMILIAINLGFNWQGGLNAILLMILISIFTIISSVAISIIIVSLTKSTAQASGLASVIFIPLSFICGSFYPLPEFPIATINNHDIQIYELLPWNQALTCFRQILTFGKGVESILPNLIVILLMGVILLIISIILFNKKINMEV